MNKPKRREGVTRQRPLSSLAFILLHSFQARGSCARQLWAGPPAFRPCSFAIPQRGLRRLLSTQHLGLPIHRVLGAGASPLLAVVEMKRFASPSGSTGTHRKLLVFAAAKRDQ